MAVFEKPAKENCDLIQEWQNRGLLVPDIERAERYLSFISYYRLSAYTIPFQIPDASGNGLHRFKPSTRFDDVLALYIFDRELRLLVMDAIERIEVAVRAQISNVLALAKDKNGQPFGAFWYLDTRHFRREYAHMKLLADIERQCTDEQGRLKRDMQKIGNDLKKGKIYPAQYKEHEDKLKKENFLRHYCAQYDSPKLPPCWMVMELLTWGQINHLYAGLASAAVKKTIARNLGLNSEILESWLRGFNSIRNFCAHHSRLWNRELGVSVKIPKSKDIRWLTAAPQLPNDIKYEHRMYSVLVAMQSVLYTVSPKSGWAKRLHDLLAKYPDISKANMGIPENWHEDGFWQDALK